jgi:hypothetical protein
MWLGTPTVLCIGNTYEMWYSATSASSYNFITGAFDTVSICYATSADGINWLKNQKNPLFHTKTPPYDSLVDRGGPWAPTVVYQPKTNNYLMWYEANGGMSNYNFSFATAPRTNTNILYADDVKPAVTVMPNPFSTLALIRVNEELHNASLLIYNSYGQQILSQYPVNSKEISIERNNLPAGVYYFQIQSGQWARAGKFIIK